MRRQIATNLRLLRALRSGLGKTAVIYPAAFLVALSIGTTVLGVIFYADDVFTAPPRMIGLLSAAWSLAYIIGCFGSRRLVARMLPRHSVFLATVLMPLFLFLMLQVDRFVWLFPLYALYGFSISLFWPPLMGWFSSNLEGRGLGRAMGRFNFSWSSGMIIGPAVAGQLGEISPQLPLQFAVLVLLGTACFILGAVATLHRISEEDDAYTEQQNNGGERDRSTIMRFPAWTGLFTAFVAHGIMVTVLPLAGPRDLQFSKGLIGFLLLLRAFADTGGHVVMGKLEFWHFRFRPMIVAVFSFAVLISALSFARGTFFLAVLLLGCGLLTAVCYSIALFHGLSGSTDRAGRMAVHEALLATGLVCGSGLGGVLYELVGFTHVFLLTALLLLGTGIAQIGLMKRLKGSESRCGDAKHSL